MDRGQGTRNAWTRHSRKVQVTRGQDLGVQGSGNWERLDGVRKQAVRRDSGAGVCSWSGESRSGRGG